jgi:hypothetical protein
MDAGPVQVSTAVCGAIPLAHESHGVRVYLSELRDPEKCVGSADAVKQSALAFHQALREILAQSALLPFRFPTIFETEEALDRHLAADSGAYTSALERIGDAVQYELIGTWTAETQIDTAQPVSGREYLQRRQQQMARVSALEEKLKSVTGNSVREWRSRHERGTHRWFALVPRPEVERFLMALRSAKASEGVRLRLSGPWPPSEFVSESRAHG